MGIAAAIAGSAVVGAGASLAGASSASSTAKSTAAANNALESQIYNENSQVLKPYEDSGNTALQEYNRLLGLGDSTTYGSTNEGAEAQQQQQAAINGFTQSAPVTAAYNQGQQSVQTALGAEGLSDSGAAQKSLLTYGDTFYNSELNNYESQLSALSGQGLTAASAQAGVGQNYAAGVSANNNTAATTSENAALSGASSTNSALSSALSAYTFNQALGSSYNGAGTSADDYNLVGSGAAALGG